MSKFFINRPIFAWVLAIITMLSGVFSVMKIPIEQYPNIAPPSVSIGVSMPGASAKIIENSVTRIVEQALIGIDNMRFFSSESNSDGDISIVVYFEPGTNPDIAQMQVQNKLQNVLPFLPEAAQRQGIRVNKANRNFLMSVALYSEDNKLTSNQISDAILTYMQDRIARINGVGMVRLFGSYNSMRIWLNPINLYKHKLATQDVIDAIKSQNADIASGQIGSVPSVKGQGLNTIIMVRSRMSSVQQFKDIVIKRTSSGSFIKLSDIAKVEIGSQIYGEDTKYNGKNGAGMAIVLASNANAVKTSNAIKKEISEIEKILPDGLKVGYPYDSMPFVEKSIKNVIKTLIEAIILVFVVMLIFLQNFRATLIPTIAVPIVLLGTCTVLFFMGFSLNTFTMFAMVIAIGLLVDDAIVVVENVERIMKTEKLNSKQATIKSMTQISSALIGIAVVLSAVFVPMAFFGGSAGSIYRQFSITIVVAMAFSVLVAIILSPSLCVVFLKNIDLSHNHDHLSSSSLTQKFAQKFNKGLLYIQKIYLKVSSKIIKQSVVSVIVYIFAIVLLVFGYKFIPKSFLPVDDQGFMYFMVELPTGSTLARTDKVVSAVSNYLLNEESEIVDRVFAITGYSRSGTAQNLGFGFIGLKDWSQRKEKNQSVMELAQRTMKNLAYIKDGLVITFFPPPIRELGSSSGFEMYLLDNAGIGHENMSKINAKFVEILKQDKMLSAVRNNGLKDTAQLKLDINDKKALSMGIKIDDVNNTINTALASTYINDFIDGGRVKRVFIQGDAKFRATNQDVRNWYVKNADGKMISIANFVDYKWVYGPAKIERFNGYESFEIQGSPAKGVSTTQAIEKIETIVNTQLPKGVSIAWGGISYEERDSQSKTIILYSISMLVVFLCLAALYESWSVPIAVMLTVPFGILGSVAFCHLFKMANDIYFQVAILTTIGLGAKNAILIVEFAKSLAESGLGLVHATLKALALRFRPIMMTSIAFILGILPLVFSTGAGQASQQAIGFALVGGMIGATFIAIVFVPLFYVLILQLVKKFSAKKNV